MVLKAGCRWSAVNKQSRGLTRPDVSKLNKIIVLIALYKIYSVCILYANNRSSDYRSYQSYSRGLLFPYPAPFILGELGTVFKVIAQLRPSSQADRHLEASFEHMLCIQIL